MSSLTRNRQELVYQAVAAIPSGSVSTYKAIAHAVGIKNPRLVGMYLHKNPDPTTIPCHRVVNAQGRVAPAFAFGGPTIQAQLLTNEGVKVEDGYVDLSKHLWTP